MLSYLLNDFRWYESAPALSLAMTAKQSFPSCHFLSQQNVPASDTQPHWSEHSTLTLEHAVSSFLPVLTFSSRVWEKTLVQPGLRMSFLPYLFSISFSTEQNPCPTRSLTPQLFPVPSMLHLFSAGLWLSPKPCTSTASSLSLNYTSCPVTLTGFFSYLI